MSSLPQLIEAYLAGPQTLRQAVTGMNREQLLARPVPGKWSTLEVVCHLADSEQAWAHRLKRVIAEDRPLLIGYDQDRFTSALAYEERNVEEELGFIDQTRRQMGRILRTLTPEALTRSGIHSEWGLISLAQMLQVEIDHIPHHVKFIEEKRRLLALAN